METKNVMEIFNETKEEVAFYKSIRRRKRTPSWFIELVYQGYELKPKKKIQYWKIAVKLFSDVNKQIAYVEYNTLHYLYKYWLRIQRRSK